MLDGTQKTDKQNRYYEKHSLTSTVTFDLVNIGRIVECWCLQVSKRASGQNGWHDFLRQLRSNAGVSRGGRRSWFGGVHMLRSGLERKYLQRWL